MARVYRKEAATVERDIFVEMTCDICGKESSSNGSWSRELYAIDHTQVEVKVIVKQEEGHNYPGGGSGTEIKVDLCPECFRNKLIPWLRSQGVHIEEREWDW